MSLSEIAQFILNGTIKSLSWRMPISFFFFNISYSYWLVTQASKSIHQLDLNIYIKCIVGCRRYRFFSSICVRACTRVICTYHVYVLTMYWYNMHNYELPRLDIKLWALLSIFQLIWWASSLSSDNMYHKMTLSCRELLKRVQTSLKQISYLQKMVFLYASMM